MYLLLVIAALATLIIFLWNQTKSIVVTRYEVDANPRLAHPVRILHVSDIQSRYFGRDQKKLIEQSRKTKPDLIVITGDLIDRNFTDYRAGKIAIDGLSEIAPVFYVDGNHETALNQEEYADFLGTISKKVEVLFNRCVSFDCRGALINIGGLAESTINESRGYDRSNKKHDEKVICDAIEEIFSNCNNGPKLLLAHEPQLIDIYAKTECDFVFSGHAHGGQFRIPFTKQGLYAPEQGILPKYTEGVHICGSGKMIISRGLGNSKFPVRLFNKPELVVVDLVQIKD